MSDDVDARCTGCRRAFTLVNRKHHCRCCGQVYCHGCCANKSPIPQLGFFQPVRVCTECLARYAARTDSTAGPPPIMGRTSSLTADVGLLTEPRPAVQSPLAAQPGPAPLRRRHTTFDSPVQSAPLPDVSAPVSNGAETASPLWQPDSAATECALCALAFTVVRRRTHCRACGKVFCRRCCSLEFTLSNYQTAQRVCLRCFRDLHQAPADRLPMRVRLCVASFLGASALHRLSVTLEWYHCLTSAEADALLWVPLCRASGLRMPELDDYSPPAGQAGAGAGAGTPGAAAGAGAAASTEEAGTKFLPLYVRRVVVPSSCAAATRFLRWPDVSVRVAAAQFLMSRARYEATTLRELGALSNLVTVVEDPGLRRLKFQKRSVSAAACTRQRFSPWVKTASTEERQLLVEYAMGTLMNASRRRPEIHADIRAAGGVGAALSLLRDAHDAHQCDDRTHEYAAGVLWNVLSSDEAAREELGDAEGVEALVRLVDLFCFARHSRCNLVLHAVGALGNAVRFSSPNKTRLRQVGGLARLVELLARCHSNVVLQSAVCCALRNAVFEDAAAQRKLFDLGGVDQLLQLGRDSGAVAAAATACVFNATHQDLCTRNSVMEGGHLAWLARCVADDPHVAKGALGENALGIIMNCSASGYAFSQAEGAADCMAVLLQLLADARQRGISHRSLEFATGAVWNLALFEGNIQPMLDGDAIPLLSGVATVPKLCTDLTKAHIEQALLCLNTAPR